MQIRNLQSAFTKRLPRSIVLSLLLTWLKNVSEKKGFILLFNYNLYFKLANIKYTVKSTSRIRAFFICLKNFIISIQAWFQDKIYARYVLSFLFKINSLVFFQCILFLFLLIRNNLPFLVDFRPRGRVLGLLILAWFWPRPKTVFGFDIVLVVHCGPPLLKTFQWYSSFFNSK